MTSGRITRKYGWEKFNFTVQCGEKRCTDYICLTPKKNSTTMAKYDFQLDKLCGMIADVRKEQSQIMHSILHEEGSLGGLICPVDGINGHY